MRKTLVITVNRAIIVRNLLVHPFFKNLQKGYAVVLLVPEEQKQEIKNMFPECAVETLHARTLSGVHQKADQIIVAIRKALIYNPTIELRTKYGLMRRADVSFKWLRHGVQKYLFGMLLSKVPGMRVLCNAIDRFAVGTARYDDVIARYKPVGLFVTNIADENEVAVLLNFKKHNIRTMAMVKSWDSTSKFSFRAMADRVFAWGEYQRQELIMFQGYRAEYITTIGVPQFDYYTQFPKKTREAFMSEYGMDPDKKTIFFGSEGPIYQDEEYIIQKLRKEILQGTLAGYQVLVRPHFSYQHQVERFAPLADGKVVFIDTQFNHSRFRDGIELGTEHLRRLSEQIQHSDVVVTSASTLALDSLAHGACPLLCGFDADPETLMKDSVRRLYTTRWFEVFRSFGLNNIIKTFDDLCEAIRAFPQRAQGTQEIQKRMCDYFCGPLDGNSGQRLHHAINISLG